MEYPQQYPQGVRHPQGHMSQYGAPPQGGPPNGNMTSPRQPSQSNHTAQQASPVVPSQNQPYASQNPQQHPPTYQMHPPMGYSQQGQPYGLPPHLQTSQYPMSNSDAAAMATAAASGQGYYSMPNPAYRPGPGAPGAPGAPAKNDARQHPGSPRQPLPPGSMTGHLGPGQPMSGQPMPGRHINHGASPMQPPVNSGQTRASVPPQMAQQPAPQQPSPEAPPPAVEEGPLYVNAKQFHRILKRRVARQKLEEQLRLTRGGRKPYLHESRHNHAMRRPRGPGGRFLTADEVAAMEKRATEPGGSDDGFAENGDSTSRSTSAQPAGAKRKAPGQANGSVKKSRLAENEEDDDEEEEAEDDEGDEDA